MSNGLLSSFASLFNGGGSGGAPSSAATGTRNSFGGSKSVFGSAFASNSRRPADPPLPYSHYGKGYTSSSTHVNANPVLLGSPVTRGAQTPYGINGKTASSSTLTMPVFGDASKGGGGGANVGAFRSVAPPGATLSTNVSIPSTAYPPLRHTWNRIRTWCDKNYSELGDTLNWPATEAQLDDLEMTIGLALPPAVRESYLCYDGQELESKLSCSDGLFFGLPLLSLEQVAEEWRFWRTVDEDPTTGGNDEVRTWMNSCPAGWVRPEYSCRGWIPLITDRVGNYIGVDLSPGGGGGAPGQVILFGRDFDTKIVLWRGEGEGGWGRFLQFFAEELENGEVWTLEEQSSSEGEEDCIGYEGYFANSGAGATRGGGGDRIGEGAAGFRLRGEYKGWSVLEAWADRSMRCWEEIGMPAGPAAWQQEPPSVVLEAPPGASEADRHLIDENGEALDAEGSTSNARRRRSFDVAVASAARDSGEPVVAEGSPAHPLDGASSPGSTASTVVQGERGDGAGVRSPVDTLSPPLPSHRARQKQKQREGSPASSSTGVPRRRPPPPVAMLDLPTIDDVRAAHAAALATQQSGHFHYDIERSVRPPPGSGGLGMGMGMKARSTMSDAFGLGVGTGGMMGARSSSSSERGAMGGAHAALGAYGDRAASLMGLHRGLGGGVGGGARASQDEEGLELEARTSSDVLYPNGVAAGRIPPPALAQRYDGPATGVDASLADVMAGGGGGLAGVNSVPGTPSGQPLIGATSPRASTSSSVSRGSDSATPVGPTSMTPNPSGSARARTLVGLNGTTDAGGGGGGLSGVSLIDAPSAPSSPQVGRASFMAPASELPGATTTTTAPASSSGSEFRDSNDSPTRRPPRAVRSPPHSRTNSIMGSPVLGTTPASAASATNASVAAAAAGPSPLSHTLAKAGAAMASMGGSTATSAASAPAEHAATTTTKV